MASRSVCISRLSAFFLLSSLGIPESPNGLLAQDATATPQVAQEEGSQYARVRFLEGDVSVVPSEAAAAPDQSGVNTPILPGDQLQTRDGRAEVQFADGGVLRLDRKTQVEASALPDLTNTLRTAPPASPAATSSCSRSSTDAQVCRYPTASIYLLSAGSSRMTSHPMAGSAFRPYVL